jgi:hypothetical protein
MNEREAKLTLIEMKLQEFLEELLPEEAMEPLVALWQAAQKCSELNLTRGDPDIWAAGIAYAFARMNFLLDDDGPLHIERAEFFEFFAGCNKSTVTQKAARIEQTLDFGYGHPDFCLPQVVDAMPRFVRLPNGMVLPERIFDRLCSDDEREIEISFADEAQSKEIERRLAEEQRARKEEKTRQRHEELRRTREEERKTQPDLFDLGD